MNNPFVKCAIWTSIWLSVQKLGGNYDFLCVKRVFRHLDGVLSVLKKTKLELILGDLGGGRVAIREMITNEIIFKVENVCFVDKRLTQMMYILM